MTFPKQYDMASAPSEVVALVHRLFPRLIPHPALATLREQFLLARIKSVDMTGHGFFVDFDIAADVPPTTPADFVGGDAAIVLEGAPAGAGCVLFARDGRLSMLEGYTFGTTRGVNARG